MSPFTLFTILLWVFGTECFVMKHDLYASVSKYLNAESKRRNFLDDFNEDPRGTMACVVSSTKIFHEKIKNLGGTCTSGEEAFSKLTKETSISKGEGSERLLNTRDQDFARRFIHFLANFWKMTYQYFTCAPARETMFYQFIICLEKFTTDLIHRCQVPYKFYPGRTLRKMQYEDEDVKKDIKEIFDASETIYSTNKIPFALNHIDGQHKAQTVGCVRNATFVLFAALRSEIPTGCSAVTNQIKKFKYEALEESPLKAGSVMEIFLKQNPMLFENSMDQLVQQRGSALQGFENCYQSTKSKLPSNIKENISNALNNYDLDVVNCQVPLKFIHPPTSRTPLKVKSNDQGDQENYINMQEPTITEKLFEEHPPLSVSCFKKITIDLFQLIGELLDEKCSNGKSLLEELEAKVKTEINDEASTNTDKRARLINIDNDVQLFETELNNLNDLGLKVFNEYQPCLKKENIFSDIKKRDDFSAGAMRYQNLYGGCGANSESNFVDGPVEDKDEPTPVDERQNDITSNVKSSDHPKNAESATDDTPEN